LRIQIVGTGLLAAALAVGFDPLALVVALVVVTMSTLGLVGPAGSARYMGFFEKLAGSASSVYTTMMFSFGGLLGALTTYLNDGTLLPMIGVMLAASIVSNVIVSTIPVGTAARAGEVRP
jgi:DHA1 family bicyclomycin/chloramphenicol resistance-like MFS transporter